MGIVSLKTELRQQMKLTPQLLQSIELLQMNSQELLSYLGRMADENPTLERLSVRPAGPQTPVRSTAGTDQIYGAAAG